MSSLVLSILGGGDGSPSCPSFPFCLCPPYTSQVTTIHDSSFLLCPPFYVSHHHFRYPPTELSPRVTSEVNSISDLYSFLCQIPFFLIISSVVSRETSLSPAWTHQSLNVLLPGTPISLQSPPSHHVLPQSFEHPQSICRNIR